jgi:hypothetical protein
MLEPLEPLERVEQNSPACRQAVKCPGCGKVLSNWFNQRRHERSGRCGTIRSPYRDNRRRAVDLMARKLKCRQGCAAKFREKYWRDEHERKFHVDAR